MVVRYLLCFALALPWPGLVAVFFNFSHSLSQRCPIIYPLHYITYTFPLFLSLSLSPPPYIHFFHCTFWRYNKHKNKGTNHQTERETITIRWDRLQARAVTTISHSRSYWSEIPLLEKVVFLLASSPTPLKIFPPLLVLSSSSLLFFRSLMIGNVRFSTKLMWFFGFWATKQSPTPLDLWLDS